MAAREFHAERLGFTPDSAIFRIASLRACFGTAQNRLGPAIGSIAIAVENTSAVDSRIRDDYFVWERAELIQNQILQQTGIPLPAQERRHPARSLLLHRGGIEAET